MYIVGVVKVDFPEISRDSTNFNHLYLPAPEELDKKKPHFRAFQERRFSTHICSSETKKFRKSYSPSKTVTKCKNSIPSDTSLTIRPPQRAPLGICVKKLRNFSFDCLENARNNQRVRFGIQAGYQISTAEK